MQYKDRHAYKRDAYARGDYDRGDYGRDYSARARNPGEATGGGNFIYVKLSPEAIKLRERFGLATIGATPGQPAGAPRISTEQQFASRDTVSTVARAVERSISQDGGAVLPNQAVATWLKKAGGVMIEGQTVLEGFTEGLLKTLEAKKAYRSMTVDNEEQAHFKQRLTKDIEEAIKETESEISAKAAFKQLVSFLDAAAGLEEHIDISDIDVAISTVITAREQLPNRAEMPKGRDLVLAGIEKIDQLVKNGTTEKNAVSQAYLMAAKNFGSALYADEAPDDFEKLLASVLFLLKDAKGYDE